MQAGPFVDHLWAQQKANAERINVRNFFAEIKSMPERALNATCLSTPIVGIGLTTISTAIPATFWKTVDQT